MSDKMRKDLERMIAGLEAKKQAIDVVLNPLKEALISLRKQPDFNDLREEAAKFANGSRRRSEPTQYEKVADYLVREDNEPKTAREIAKGAGVNANSLVAVLYTTHRDHFTRTKQAGFKNRWIWSLTQTALDDARQHPVGSIS